MSLQDANLRNFPFSAQKNMKSGFSKDRKAACYLVSENFILTPKSAVMVGYDVAETRGVFFCQSRNPLRVNRRLNV